MGICPVLPNQLLPSSPCAAAVVTPHPAIRLNSTTDRGESCEEQLSTRQFHSQNGPAEGSSEPPVLSGIQDTKQDNCTWHLTPTNV